jgi:hypothetical protein
MSTLVMGMTSVLILTNSTSTAYADTLSVRADVIKVQASVTPKTYLVIDDSSKIIQIDSNNNLDIKPSVYVRQVKAGNERPLTRELYRQYETIVPSGRNHIGTLYRAVNRPSSTFKSHTSQVFGIMRLFSIGALLR